MEKYGIKWNLEGHDLSSFGAACHGLEFSFYKDSEHLDDSLGLNSMSWY
ncbi:hypothetical protein AM1_E0052 (plasmid) [Acaryochloris marina MBIC11017]|uniref:Uncharacterized protein n=1 Tax=Acaryochloris marina (strain MBIC 11017) TaxID=329726 RepID=A8ZP86_ACAM1|nr:hypothetical protein AM1_E0052 [Acaryochloris marina MBIC11017]